MNSTRLFATSAATMLLIVSPVLADPIDALAGKFTFNWHSEPSRAKCVKVEGPLMAEFKSAKFRCDLKFISNTASGARAQVCTETKGKREYLIFATQRACEGERKTQASNG